MLPVWWHPLDQLLTSNLKPETILQLGLSPVSEQEMSAKRSVVYHSGEKWSLLEFVPVFCEFLESYDCRTKCNSSLGMEYNGKLYGFSAVKVKIVDSLI